MSNRKNDRTVSPRPDGQWANKRNGAERASSLHPTQKRAEDAARRQIRQDGGGELTTQGTNGRIRSKDTIKPAKDPFPPRDKEH
jgi:hypothetical protein